MQLIKKQWQNWSGSVQCMPTIYYPETNEDIVKIFETARQNSHSVRVYGSAHSFTPLCQTNDIMISLDKMQGIISLDKIQGIVTVWGGTKLNYLGELLHQQGLALVNMGDIDVQSLAGALTSGTHGTGKAFGILATQLIALKLVTPEGEILRCSMTENPELFKAAQVSLGVLGIITEMTLQCRPSYQLKISSNKENDRDIAYTFATYNDQYRNAEYYWFPAAQKTWLKLTEEVPIIDNNQAIKKRGLAQKIQVFTENNLFGLLCNTAARFPNFSHTVSRISAIVAGGPPQTDYSHRIYATTRLVRFHEMEYNIPLENYAQVQTDLIKLFAKHAFQTPIPIEVRRVKADDIWLSPAYQRESVYFAFHQYKPMPCDPYFSTVEPLLVEAGGRPHWGKMHTRKTDFFEKNYPKWNDFLKIRQQLDPRAVLLNAHLKNIFNPSV